jgi:predicted XRE-type DNA-binding protein
MGNSKRFLSVWDAIEDTPQASASMKARSTLMMELSSYIEKQGLTQAQAADLLGVTQPRVSDLIRGKIDLFSLDTLLNMASVAGMSPVLKLSKPRAVPIKLSSKPKVAVTACDRPAPRVPRKNTGNKKPHPLVRGRA